jgi:hypothetical protein
VLVPVIPSEARNPSSIEKNQDKERFIAQKARDGPVVLTPRTPFGMTDSEFFSNLLSQESPAQKCGTRELIAGNSLP